ncbi:hypothetical protein Tco_0448176 [Tanacetum coccineum]
MVAAAKLLVLNPNEKVESAAVNGAFQVSFSRTLSRDEIEKKEIEPDEEPSRGALWLKGRVRKKGRFARGVEKWCYIQRYCEAAHTKHHQAIAIELCSLSRGSPLSSSPLSALYMRGYVEYSFAKLTINPEYVQQEVTDRGLVTKLKHLRLAASRGSCSAMPT